MKTVERKEFLTYPAGTIFYVMNSEVEVDDVSHDMLGYAYFKGKSCSSVDGGEVDSFFYTPVTNSYIKYRDRNGRVDTLADLTVSFIQRNVFYVWEESDLVQLKSKITNAIDIIAVNQR